MNGSASPDPPTAEAGDSGRDEITVAAINGHRACSASDEAGQKGSKPSPSRPKRGGLNQSPAANDTANRHNVPATNGDDNGGDSEAETLIDSPVKKKEAEKQNQPVKLKRPPKHRIGSLPVPTGGDDDDDSAAVSSAPSTVMSVERVSNGMREESTDRKDNASDNDEDSDSLSSPHSQSHSRRSSPGRAESEQPGSSQRGPQSPNPRKRKHRASSVSLPNKRPSMDIPRRRLRGLQSEDFATDRSPSPKLRSHRRAASMQAAFLDGSGESTARKRKGNSQALAKDAKMSKNGWEESDASSETTSHGLSDFKRLPRGIGRSTSTPGRPAGREHKRHVNKYGFTKLAEACEDGDLDLVKEWRERDPDQLELAEFAGNKPLQIAALNGNVEVVDYLIDQGCQIDCANVDKDTPLIDAAENGHLDVVNSLLTAGVDPLRQNLKGQQALDAVTDETEDADEIRSALRRAIEAWNSNGAKQRREEEEEEMRHRAGPTKELHFMARTYENLLKLVQINDRTGVQEFLDARVPVDNAIIGAAAKTGDVYLVNMLLAEVPEKKRIQKPEKRILGVLGTSHFEMVKFMTELEDFNPHYRNRQGKSWPEIAEEKRGPNWRQESELMQRLYDQRVVSKERRSSSPVSKRDSAKRRFISQAAHEESEEDEAPQRKNGRKLMSKKEMRVARGKATSEGSSDESDSEVATGTEMIEESSMKPPESPVTTKRTPTRLRTKSFSSQPTEASPRTRRRSSSFRAPSEQSLPTIEEKSADNVISTKQSEEEQKRAAEEAEEAEEAQNRELQQEEEKAEEERAQADAAAKRAAEEEAQRVEEERKAEAARREEERKAEATRREEEERRAEEARLAEEERKRKEEEEMREAERLHRDQVIASLPDTVSSVLSPNSLFDYGEATASTYVLRRFAPLQVLKHEMKSPLTTYPQGPEGTFWVANVQAAPFIGQKGIELMIRSDVPGFQGSLADRWETRDVFRDDMGIIECILTSHPQDSLEGVFREEEEQLTIPFEEQMARIASRINAAANVKDRLRNGEATLRYVRLDDVLNNLHPALAEARIEVRFDYLASPTKPAGFQDDEDFVETLGRLLDGRPAPRMYVNGVIASGIDTTTTTTRGSTPVVVTHQKPLRV